MGSTCSVCSPKLKFEGSKACVSVIEKVLGNLAKK